MTGDARTPVVVLTGFLGSGKTTVLQQLMRRAEWEHTAVIVNELGAMGLDHLLVQHLAPDVKVLPSGCICCSVSEDLTRTLAELHARRARGELSFQRVVIETTGLADPMPVVHTLSVHAQLAQQFRLAGMVTTVDACNGSATLERHPEACRQVAMADTLLLTKTDLSDAQTIARLQAQLLRINASAPLRRVLHGHVDPEHLADLEQQFVRLAGTPPARQAGQRGWILKEADAGSGTPLATAAARNRSHHAKDITTACFRVETPFAGGTFQRWLEMLCSLRGDQLLRFKGLIHTAEDPERPLVMHSAQHLIHAPQALPAWPGADRRSLLVFITQGLESGLIERTLFKFTGARAIALHP